MSVAHIPTLAEETYRQGLSVLSDALELTVAGSAPGRERLDQEKSPTWRRKSRKRKRGGGHAEPLRIKEASLSSHRQRLDMLDQLQLAGGPAALPGRAVRGLAPSHSHRGRRNQDGQLGNQRRLSDSGATDNHSSDEGGARGNEKTRLLIGLEPRPGAALPLPRIDETSGGIDHG